jgi:hypothetical protein
MVVGITDGDSLNVANAGKETPVRLEGIDAPESDQTLGNAAKQALSDLASGRQVNLTNSLAKATSRNSGMTRVDHQAKLKAESYRKEAERIKVMLEHNGNFHLIASALSFSTPSPDS